MRFTDLTMPSFEGAKDLVLREKCALEDALLENLALHWFLTEVHLTGGCAAFAGCLLLGRRIMCRELDQCYG